MFYITSADSAALVVDHLTSNGNPDSPYPQRIFWSAVQALVAMALVLTGDTDALGGLRNVSIVAGVPYTVILSVMCAALHVACIGAMPRAARMHEI